MVIPNALFPVAAIRRVLFKRLFLQPGLGFFLPGCAFLPAWPHCSPDIKPHIFTKEVVIGRRIAGKMASYKMAMLINGLQPLLFENFPLFFSKKSGFQSPQQLPSKGPIQQTNRQFQRTSPVRPQWVWTLFKPRLQKRSTSQSIFWTLGEVIGLSECDKFKMPVRLPQIFDVPNQRLNAIVESFTKLKRRHCTGLWISIPMRGKTQLAILKRKNIKMPSKDSVSRFNVGQIILKCYTACPKTTLANLLKGWLR